MGTDRDTALGEIETGDVFAFRGTNWVSRLIQFWTRSVYSHVGFALWVKADSVERLCVLEATEPGGVRLFPMDVYLSTCAANGTQIDWYTVVDPNVNRDKIAGYALSQWGKRYASLRQLSHSFGGIGTLLRTLLRLPARLDPDRFFCSQLCAEALRYAGCEPDSGLPSDPALTDPGAVTRYPCLQRRGVVTP